MPILDIAATEPLQPIEVAQAIVAMPRSKRLALFERVISGARLDVVPCTEDDDFTVMTVRMPRDPGAARELHLRGAQAIVTFHKTCLDCVSAASAAEQLARAQARSGAPA